MEGNRDEAEKCVEIAREALNAGNREKAQRFLQKAEKLYPLASARGEALSVLSPVPGPRPQRSPLGTLGPGLPDPRWPRDERPDTPPPGPDRPGPRCPSLPQHRPASPGRVPEYPAVILPGDLSALSYRVGLYRWVFGCMAPLPHLHPQIRRRPLMK